MLERCIPGTGWRRAPFSARSVIKLRMIEVTMRQHFPNDTVSAFEKFMSPKKVAFFDIAIVIEAFAAARERTIGAQQEAILETSTRGPAGPRPDARPAHHRDDRVRSARSS